MATIIAFGSGFSPREWSTFVVVSQLALLGFNPNPLQVGSNPDSSTPPLEAVLLELLFSTVRVSKPLANTFQRALVLSEALSRSSERRSPKREGVEALGCRCGLAQARNLAFGRRVVSLKRGRARLSEPAKVSQRPCHGGLKLIKGLPCVGGIGNIVTLVTLSSGVSRDIHHKCKHPLNST
ncbi:hypothetical protein DEO72_LG11g2093 [Vigna unguiculata]|uniref:Uncharacterized protein n=1 Tax=Vigna unguiculata TaxID=3917 RepID=A0A4D6NQY7_VIGUN|nr:hypothetical protein DEO72_LG11g2092 [Vigna unguiculata]QCE15085.1 hypothetical protein DEO72_LG11g2093 [Vigna unguiculata]